MSRRMSLQLLWIVAVASLMAGGGWTWRSLRNARDASAGLVVAVGDVGELRRMKRDVDVYENARAKVEQVSGAAPALNGLLRAELPEFMPEIKKLDDTKVLGWVFRYRQLSFRRVPISRVMKFVSVAESPEPAGKRLPLRLVSCTVRPSHVPSAVLAKEAEVLGDVTLVFCVPERTGD